MFPSYDKLGGGLYTNLPLQGQSAMLMLNGGVVANGRAATHLQVGPTSKEKLPISSDSCLAELRRCEDVLVAHAIYPTTVPHNDKAATPLLVVYSNGCPLGL